MSLTVTEVSKIYCSEIVEMILIVYLLMLYYFVPSYAALMRVLAKWQPVIQSFFPAY